VTSKEFNPVLAKYLTEGFMSSEDYESTDMSQKDCIKKIDLARAFLKRKL